MNGFRYALNASTLFPFSLPLDEQIRVAAAAGYDGIEVWVRDIEAYKASGGSLSDIKRLSEDSGIAIVNGIAFFPWTAYDPDVRRAGLEQARLEMAMLREVGCTAAAAPPSGDVGGVDLDGIADNFAVLAGIARGMGVEPILEFWGRSKVLSRLDQAAYAAMRSGIPSPKLLLDLFHMYTGGSRLESVGMFSAEAVGIVHVNDYPATPDVSVITDRERVFPGDGVGPSRRFAELLTGIGYRGYLSLELFIPGFGDMTALDTARMGLEKTKATYGG